MTSQWVTGAHSMHLHPKTPCAAQVDPHKILDCRTLLLFNFSARSHSYKASESSTNFTKRSLVEKEEEAISCTPLLIY